MPSWLWLEAREQKNEGEFPRLNERMRPSSCYYPTRSGGGKIANTKNIYSPTGNDKVPRYLSRVGSAHPEKPLRGCDLPFRSERNRLLESSRFTPPINRWSILSLIWTVTTEQGAGLEKRIRERARKEKHQEKELRKLKRKSQTKPAKDSDLAGMRPGPQPGQIIDID